MARAVSWPAGLLAAATLVFLGLAVFGRDPIWAPMPMTLSEAAASGNAGEVARLLAEGHDPNGQYAVQAGLLTRGTVVVTPLEAADRTGRSEIAALIIRAGGNRDVIPGSGAR